MKLLLESWHNFVNENKLQGYKGKAYHYTTAANAESIEKNGFRKYDGLAGTGVYCVMEKPNDIRNLGKSFATHVIEFDVDLHNVPIIKGTREAKQYDEDDNIDGIIVDREESVDYLIVRNLASISNMKVYLI
jgi:hypothetical protein